MKTIRKMLFVILFATLFVKIEAQLNRDWVNTYTTSDSAYMDVIGLYDAGDGNVIKATMITKFSPPDNYNRFLLQKIAPSGLLIWQQEYSHPVYDQFNLYMGGRDAAGNLYFGGQLVLNQSTSNWFIISFNDAGQVRWETDIVEDTYNLGQSYNLQVDAGGNVYASGNLEGDGIYYGVIVKYDNNGNEQWVKKVPQVYQYGADMLIAANGDLIASDGMYEVTRFSPAGNVLWSTPDTAGMAYASPSLTESVDGSIYAISFLGYNYSLKKLTANGVFQWNFQNFSQYLAFGDNSVNLTTDQQGNIFVSGVNSTDTIYQTAVFKFNPSGQEIWRQTFTENGTPELNDVYDLIILPCGNVAVAGLVVQPSYLASTVLLNGGTGDMMDFELIDSIPITQQYMLYNTGGLFVAGEGSYSTALIHFSSAVSIDESLNNNLDVNIYPNPFSENITIKSDCEISKYELRNLSGQLIRSASLNVSKTLLLDGISSGVYLLSIYGNTGGYTVKKIIKR